MTHPSIALRDAIITHLLAFITEELDPDPEPWENYVVGTYAQRIVRDLEAQARRR